MPYERKDTKIGAPPPSTVVTPSSDDERRTAPWPHSPRRISAARGTDNDAARNDGPELDEAFAVGHDKPQTPGADPSDAANAPGPPPGFAAAPGVPAFRRLPSQGDDRRGLDPHIASASCLCESNWLRRM